MRPRALYLVLFSGCTAAAALASAVFPGPASTGAPEAWTWTAATMLFAGLWWTYGKERGTPAGEERPVWTIPAVAAVCLVVSHIMRCPEFAGVSLIVDTVLVAVGEELVFRFAPFALLAHCKKRWRNMTTAIFGTIIFVAAHMPSLDILLIDKLCFALAATALVIVSGGIWLAVSLHVSSNLLWHAMVVNGQQGHVSYFAADLVLVLVASIVALRLRARKEFPIGVGV